MKLVIHPPIDEQRLARIREAAGGMQVVNCADEDEALREMPDADAFFGKMTPPLLERAGKLRWVQSPTASLEHYLFPELIEHPCQVSNMRGIFSDVIADHVLSYVLCIARNLHVYLRQQQQRLWEPVGGEAARLSMAAGPGTVTEIDRRHRHLADCTLGVIGTGAIGAEILCRASAFGMSLLGLDPLVRSIPGTLEEVWPMDRLEDLLEACDFVVIAAPHTPETEKMFRRPQFERMKPSAWLINIGRGVIVDLADLTAALEEGRIAGAALDVFEVEPLPAEHPLWGMENVIITPHSAAASPRIAERHLEVLLENVRRFVNGEPPATLVDKHRWF
jgi:phosphoglycerate dehydrogenase-like enzyme